MIELSAAPAQAPSVATAELDGEAVLYDETDGAVHLLNTTAALLWSCFDGETDLATLIADLAAAYDVDSAVMTEHVLAITRDLAAKSLLTGVGADPA